MTAFDCRRRHVPLQTAEAQAFEKSIRRGRQKVCRLDLHIRRQLFGGSDQLLAEADTGMLFSDGQRAQKCHVLVALETNYADDASFQAPDEKMLKQLFGYILMR